MDKKEKQNPKTERLELMCALTDDEQRLRGIELVGVQGKIAELKIQAKALKEEISNLEDKSSDLSTIIKFKQEFRLVECEARPDWKAGTMTYIRLDLNEIARIRQLDGNDRQPALPMDEDEKGAAAGESPAPNLGTPANIPANPCKCGHEPSDHLSSDPNDPLDERPCVREGCACLGYSKTDAEGNSQSEKYAESEHSRGNRNIEKLLALGIVPFEMHLEEKSIETFTGIADDGARISETVRYKSQAETRRQMKEMEANGCMELFDLCRVPGKINALVRQRADGSVWIHDETVSWGKAPIQDIEQYRTDPNILED